MTLTIHTPQRTYQVEMLLKQQAEKLLTFFPHLQGRTGPQPYGPGHQQVGRQPYGQNYPQSGPHGNMNTREKPGYIQGKHYSDYTSKVQTLKKADRQQELEQLLLTICDATEAEAQAEGLKFAPAYYKELAILYRKQDNDRAELAILERYVRQTGQQARSDLVERLEKVRANLQ